MNSQNIQVKSVVITNVNKVKDKEQILNSNEFNEAAKGVKEFYVDRLI